MGARNFRVALVVAGQIATLTEPMDFVDAAGACRAMVARGYPAELLVESRALARLSDELAACHSAGTLTITLPDNGEATAVKVKIVEAVDDDMGPASASAAGDDMPRELRGPTAEDIEPHYPPAVRDREGKDGDACGD